MAELLLGPSALPTWLRPLAERVPRLGLNMRRQAPRWVARIRKLSTPRKAAVLILIGGDPGGRTLPQDASVLLTRRATTLRQHSGQVAFPGGALESGDQGPVAAALREAQEETGVDLPGVRPFGVLPSLYIPPSGFDVTPVLAYWEKPSHVRSAHPGETDLVRAVGLDELLDPANRLMGKRGPLFKGPAFDLSDMFVWGFTGGLLSSVLAEAGWERPWDHGRVVDVTTRLRFKPES